MHRDMLVHNETNVYLHASKTWEKVLEVSGSEGMFLRACAGSVKGPVFFM